MNARLLDLRFGIVRALTVEMDGVSENPTRNVSKTLRLFQEIFGAVITNFINEISVRKAGLGDVRSVKNYFASIRDGGIGFIHSLSARSEEHTSELQSRPHLVCRLLLEKKKKKQVRIPNGHRRCCIARSDRIRTAARTTY